MAKEIHPDSRSLQAIAILGVVALIAVYSLSIIPRQVISPEICQYFLMAHSVSTFSQALHKFLVFNEYWYRPFTYYLTNFIFYHLFDMHNIYTMKTLSVFMVLLNGFIVTLLSRRLFDSTFIERLIVFSLIVTHPIYYGITCDGITQFEILFNIFLSLFVINFLDLLENVSRKIDSAPKARNRYAIIQAILCCVFIVCTITANERGLAVLVTAWALYFYYHRYPSAQTKLKLDPVTTGVIAFSVIAFVLYFCFVYGPKPGISGNWYRTDFEPGYVIINLVRVIEWPFRFYFFKYRLFDPVHGIFLFNLFALPFFAALFCFVTTVRSGDDIKEKNRMTILAILFLCSLLIPVLFGGFDWHFYTAAMYASIATGRAVWFWMRRLDGHLQAASLALFFLWLSMASVLGTADEMKEGGELQRLRSVTPMALQDRTLHDIKAVPEVVYYDTGDFGGFLWPLGGCWEHFNHCGGLFKYLYNDTRIIEIALVHGAVPKWELPLCRQVRGKKAVYFGINAQNLSWHTIEEKNYCEL